MRAIVRGPEDALRPKRAPTGQEVAPYAQAGRWIGKSCGNGRPALEEASWPQSPVTRSFRSSLE